MVYACLHDGIRRGAGWGENGYFRIERGSDAHAIESKPIAVIPELGPKVKVTDQYLEQLLEASRAEYTAAALNTNDMGDDESASLSPIDS